MTSEASFDGPQGGGVQPISERRLAVLHEAYGIRQRRPRGVSDPLVRKAIEALQAIAEQPHVSEELLAEFFTVAPTPRQSFAAGIRLRDKVATGLETAGAEVQPSILRNANDFSRWRRRLHFKKRRESGDRSPILLAEGDSWFHFPIFLRDVVVQLSPDHLVWPLGAAGGTLDQMVNGEGPGRTPGYLAALCEWGDLARAFLFSGGGNDLIGEGPDGASAILSFARRFEPGRSAAWHVDTPEFHRKLALYEATYRHLIAEVGARRPNLPIVIHAYDYVLPCPFHRDDRRRPRWMARDRFFGSVLPQLGIVDPQLQSAALRHVVDKMNIVQRKLAGGNVAGGAFAHVFHVDLRGALGPNDWADELHPTNAGYAKVAQRFRKVLRTAGVS